jgi:hypothetical protein
MSNGALEVKNCHESSYVEYLYQTENGPDKPQLIRFARVPVCVYSECRRVTGPVASLVTGEGKRKPSSFTSESWRMMIDTHPKPPFIFHMHKSGVLVPEQTSVMAPGVVQERERERTEQPEAPEIEENEF